MSISPTLLKIANIEIDIVRKDIKNMHLAVYPPHGRIRLAVPQKTDEDVVRLFAISKLGWIKKHVKNFQEQARETKRDYVSGESLFFQGIRSKEGIFECFERLAHAVFLSLYREA